MGPAMASEQPHPGRAGASARAKAHRIRARREAIYSGRGRLGRMLAYAFPSPQQERLRREEHNWRTGADGERRLAADLARRCPGVRFLHDRRAPMSRTNIDHIAVAASGVYVIDCKRYKGRIEVANPLFGEQKLTIARRERTDLIGGLEKQVAHVMAVIADPTVPVHGCLCFVAPEGPLTDVGLPTFRTLEVKGYALYYARRLARQLNRSGPLGAAQAQELAVQLAERLPSAGIAPRPDAAA